MTDIGESQLDVACHKGDVAGVAQFLDGGWPLESKNQWGRTLAQEAAMHGQLQILKLLVERGASLQNTVSLAASNGKADCLRYLITKGADIEGRSDGMTPLMQAIAFSRVECVRLLVEAGADCDAKKGNARVVDFARGDKRDLILGILGTRQKMR